MLAAATSLFSRSSLNTNYTIQGASNPIGSAFAAIPSPAFGASQAQPASTLNDTPPFSIGLWKILRAENKSSRKVRIFVPGRAARKLTSPHFPRRRLLCDRLSRCGCSRRRLSTR